MLWHGRRFVLLKPFHFSRVYGAIKGKSVERAHPFVRHPLFHLCSCDASSLGEVLNRLVIRVGVVKVLFVPFLHEIDYRLIQLSSLFVR